MWSKPPVQGHQLLPPPADWVFHVLRPGPRRPTAFSSPPNCAPAAPPAVVAALLCTLLCMRAAATTDVFLPLGACTLVGCMQLTHSFVFPAAHASLRFTPARPRSTPCWKDRLGAFELAQLTSDLCRGRRWHMKTPESDTTHVIAVRHYRSAQDRHKINITHHSALSRARRHQVESEMGGGASVYPA